MSLLRCPRADAVGWAAPEAEDDNNNEKDNGRKAHNRQRQKKRKIADDESNNLAADQPTSNYAVSDAGVGAPNSISTAPQDVTSTTTGTLSTETTGIAGSAADLDGSAHEAEAAVTTLNSTENISDAVTLTSTAEEYDRTDTADSNPANDDGSTIVTFDPQGSEIVITGTATVTVLDGRVEIMGCIIGSTDEIPCVQVCSPDGSWSSSLAILDVSATIKKGQEEDEFASSCNTITRIKISPLPWDRSEASSTCTFHVASRSDVRFAITVADRWKAAATTVLSDMHKPPNASGPVEYALDPARVVVCGAKSVGKSTYVRYLVNKMMTCCTDRNGKRIRVAVLDCDVGQPELGPPGLITLTILERPLLSPPHIHMICNGQAQDSTCAHGKETNFEAAPGHASARFFGSVSAKADPSSYVAAIASLLSQYETLAKKEYQDERNQHECGAFPLVVNTSGWVKGMGFEILSSIVDAVKPGHIIQIVGAARAKFFDLTPHAFEGRSIHVVEAFGSMSRLPTEQDMTPPQSRSVSPIPPSTTAGVDRAAACNETAVLTKPNAADTSTVPATSTLRSLRFASYFLGGYKHLLASGAKFWPSAGGIYDAHCNVASKLAAMKPYSVPFRSVYCSVPSSAEYQGRVKANDLMLKSLNGAIVGLCHWSPDSEKQMLGVLDECSVRVAPLNLNMALLPCVGLGIIRGVDRSRQCFYILTPITPEQLRNRAPNVIVRAGIQVPIECIFSGVHSEAFPYQSSDGLASGIGDDMMKSRNAPKKK